MCDEWMSVVRIPMTLEHYHQLPRHPAYRYEYLSGCAVLTPRAKFYHARLILSRFAPDPELNPAEPTELEVVQEADFPALKVLFARAFHHHQPFAGLVEETLQRAADQSLEKTRTGGDGPWVRPASFLIRSPRGSSPIGAIFITLLPEGDPEEFNSYYWNEPAPADLVERNGGRAHLTWIFVHPLLTGEGTGTTLLRAAVRALIDRGYTELYSTFLVGNHASLLWHWRSGFELLSNPFSVRRMRREIRGQVRRVTTKEQ
jgi:GNAT superfamily N-acetyltransferase